VRTSSKIINQQGEQSPATTTTTTTENIMYSSKQLDEIAKTIKKGQEFYITQNKLFKTYSIYAVNRNSKITIDSIYQRQPRTIGMRKDSWLHNVKIWCVEIYIEHTETQEEEDFRIMTLEKFATLLEL
jgi:hypothetical protein